MAEVRAEATYVRHHAQKIALFLAAMRKFAAALRADGWQVAYTGLDDPDNTHAIGTELLRRATRHGASEVLATMPGEWRLRAILDDLPLTVRQFDDDRFLCPPHIFADWAEGRKQLRMEYFYREMRRRTGFLMEGDKPAGGQWNFDHDNRKPPRDDLFRPPASDAMPDAETEAVLDLVAREFPDATGHLRPFRWATDRDGALAALEHFATQALPRFGDYQDAMLAGDPVLYHSLLSPYLNLGLLLPYEVCARAQAEWHAGRAPLNAVEGFIRQILGWREFVRGVYDLKGPGYTASNVLGYDRDLPAVYWGGLTRMACLRAAVDQTLDRAYAHHIQRLMVTGNFALLAGVDPAQVHEWYLSVYIDAVEWVELPNVLGMSQYADGGLMASKPYVATGKYIERMGHYCKGCRYKPALKTGEQACPFTTLYWDFLMRHEALLSRNQRMALQVKNLARLSDEERAAIRAQATAIRASSSVPS